jgi:hypothetical protein
VADCDADCDTRLSDACDAACEFGVGVRSLDAAILQAAGLEGSLAIVP